jgi:hypothetical protein
MNVHADLRIACERASEIMLDAIEQHLERGVEPDLLRRVAVLVRRAHETLRAYETRHGIEPALRDYRVSLETIVARAEADGAVEISGVVA